MTSIECGQLFSNIEDMIFAWERVHAILSGRLNDKRGAVILKRTLDGGPLIFSHCRGGMEDDRFCADMNRVNSVLASARGIVHSVLQEGTPRIKNDLDLVVDYAALDASIWSELCVPLVIAGDRVFLSKHGCCQTNSNSSQEGQVGIFCPIVQPTPHCLSIGIGDLLHRSAVRTQPVRDNANAIKGPESRIKSQQVH